MPEQKEININISNITFYLVKQVYFLNANRPCGEKQAKTW